MGQQAWHDENHFVYFGEGSVCQGDVGKRGWVEGAGEYSEAAGMSAGATTELHKSLYTGRARDCSRAPGESVDQAALASSSSMDSPVSPSNWWRSAASWQRMQYLVHGTASSRLGLMSSSQ